MSKRRMDMAYREEQRYNSGMWDSWDGWNHNPAPPPPPVAQHQQNHALQLPPQQYNGHYQPSQGRENHHPYENGEMRSQQQYRFSAVLQLTMKIGQI